jgi:hypothetical protein
MNVINSKHLNPFDITEKQVNIERENHLQELFQNYPASKFFFFNIF